jgi:hypothetical protein
VDTEYAPLRAMTRRSGSSAFTYSATVDKCGFRRGEGDFTVKSFATNFIQLPFMYILSPSF